MGIEFYKNIFAQHKTDNQTFEASFQYYSENPTALQEIYQQAADDLTLKQSSLKKFAPVYSPSRDSLRPRKIPFGLAHLRGKK